ncbi:MAG: Smr/MutS family protein [Pseudomonadota bacterium]
MKDKETEKELFEEAVRGTQPIVSDKVPPTPERPEPIAKFTREDEQRVQQELLDSTPEELGLESGDQLSYTRQDVSLRVLKKLRRGKYKIQDEIDLHGLTVAQAKVALDEYIRECRAQGVRCVRIVHGKGMGSGHKGPVLKGKVNVWLRRHKDVAAFVSAPGNDGGTGALYALLD